MALRDDYTCVAVEIDDEGIAWVTFNRPEKRNAMNPTLHYEMEEIMMPLPDPDRRGGFVCVVRSGEARRRCTRVLAEDEPGYPVLLPDQ